MARREEGRKEDRKKEGGNERQKGRVRRSIFLQRGGRKRIYQDDPRSRLKEATLV